MTLPNIFAPVTVLPTQDLDENYNAVGAGTLILCTATGTNSLSLTPISNQTSVGAYGTSGGTNYPVKFGFIAASTSTGNITAAVGALASLPVYQPSGSQAASGTFTIGYYYEITYFVSSDFNSGNGAFMITSAQSLASATPSSVGSVKGLAIKNDATTPNTKIDINAYAAVMVVPASGQPIYDLTVAVVIDLTTTGANGMDTGTRPTSAFVYLYLISNGSTTSGLATATSPSSGNPTMPSGYTYALYVGAMPLDNSKNLYPVTLSSSRAQYVTKQVTPTVTTTSASSIVTSVSSMNFINEGALVVATGVPANTSVVSTTGTSIVMSANATATHAAEASTITNPYPQMAIASTLGTTWTAVTVTSFIPATATRLALIVSSSDADLVVVAANNYGPTIGSSPVYTPWILTFTGISQGSAAFAEFALESSVVYWAGNAVGGTQTMNALGWLDPYVNA